MLRSIKDVEGYVLQATDGDIGRCKDFLFDERQWVVRYMVADTGKWIPKRRVLISPVSLGEPDWRSRRFSVLLSKDEVEKAPGIEEDQPVSRQHEAELFMHYGYAPYWQGTGLWGLSSVPDRLRAEEETAVATAAAPAGDPGLRSIDEVVGYHVHASDDEVGHVEDFIVDDESWVIRYVVVDTRNWLPGRKVLVAPDWFAGFDWRDRSARVDMTRDQVERSPAYDPTQPVNREYETRLYDFLGRPTYWR